MTELALIGDANDDQMRVVKCWLKEKNSGRFDAGVSHLNDLLRMGKVFPDETVNVGCALVSHGSPPFNSDSSSKVEGVNCLPSTFLFARRVGIFRLFFVGMSGGSARGGTWTRNR